MVKAPIALAPMACPRNIESTMLYISATIKEIIAGTENFNNSFPIFSSPNILLLSVTLPIVMKSTSP